MNEVSIDDKKYLESEGYKKFKQDNPVYGYLRVRAFSASEAVPISNLRVKVSKIIDNTKVIFFNGLTDSSGTIKDITLPTRIISNDNLVVPQFTIYDLEATKEKVNLSYKVNIYEGMMSIQNINVVPGDNRWL